MICFLLVQINIAPQNAAKQRYAIAKGMSRGERFDERTLPPPCPQGRAMLLKPAWDAVTRRARRRSARFPYETALWVGTVLADPGEIGRRDAYEDLEAAGVWYVRERLLTLDNKAPSSIVEIPGETSRVEREGVGWVLQSVPMSFVRQWLSWRGATEILIRMIAATRADSIAAGGRCPRGCGFGGARACTKATQSRRQADVAKWQLRASVSQGLQKACEQGQQKACEQLESRPPTSKPVRRSCGHGAGGVMKNTPEDILTGGLVLAVVLFATAAVLAWLAAG